MLRMIQLLASNVEYSIDGMDGVGRFVLGLPMFVEVLEGEELREFLRDHARYILEKVSRHISDINYYICIPL